MTNGKSGITRRKFITTAGLSAGVAVVGSVWPRLVKKASAAKDAIVVGRLNPTTGPLAAFGEPSPWVDERALAAINRDGGIYIEELGRKLPVRMKMADTESDPTKAGELAARLILNDEIDVMLVLHTPNTVNPVTAACERFGVPCIALDAPVETWLPGGPFEWTHHAFWSVEEDFYPVCAGMWSGVETNKVVGLLLNNDADGAVFGDIFRKNLPGDGFKVVDPGTFPYGTQDFTALINTWKKNGVEILFGNLIPPDFVTCWRQCRRMGFTPKIATVGRAILFPSAVEALGDGLAQGLTTEVWWSPLHPYKSSLTGQTPGDLCGAWTEETGRQWTQPLGFKHAGWEIFYDALNRARTLDKAKIVRAVAETRLETIVGPIRYNERKYSRSPLVGGQWVKGDKYPWDLRIVYNEQHPEIPTTGKMVEITAG